MEKLFNNVKKELRQIEETGLNSGNIDNAYKLASIAKNLYKIQKEDKEGMRRYTEDRYENRGDYRDGGYRDGGYRDGMYPYEPMYGQRGVSDGRGRYRGDDRWNEHLNRIMEGADMYQYGRTRYRDGGDSERMYDGLEKLMYAICMFIESTMDFAESPEEKEIIRKHIQKIKNI